MIGRVAAITMAFALGALCVPASAAENDDGGLRVEGGVFSRHFEQDGPWQLRLDVVARGAESVDLEFRGVEGYFGNVKLRRREDVAGRPFRIDDGRFLRGFDFALDQRSFVVLEVRAEGDGEARQTKLLFKYPRCNFLPPKPAALVCQAKP
jgi:hypothetical protein